MSDIPIHQEVAENVAEALESLGKNAARATIWIAFDSPTVLNRKFVGNDDYALATFSNSTKSNDIIVDVLFRSGTHGGREQVPVEIRSFDHHVEPMETCPTCERSRLDRQGYTRNIFGLLGAIVAVLALWCVRSRPGKRKEWWTMSALAGCSGFVLFLTGSVVDMDLSVGLSDDWPISVDLRPGTDFVVPLVLTFVAFVLLNLLARVTTSLAKRNVPAE